MNSIYIQQLVEMIERCNPNAPTLSADLKEIHDLAERIRTSSSNHEAVEGCAIIVRVLRQPFAGSSWRLIYGVADQIKMKAL